MIEGLTVGMCVAFGAGILVGAGAGCMATSAYYELTSDDSEFDWPFIKNGKLDFDYLLN